MEHLKEKLSNWEATPPQAVWDRLSQDLPDHGLGRLAATLDTFEAAPPAGIWDRIESELSPAATPAKLIPLTTRYRKHIRYASAAVLAGILLFGSMLLLPKRTDSDAGLVANGAGVTRQNGAGTNPPSRSGATVNSTTQPENSNEPQIASLSSTPTRNTGSRLALLTSPPAVLHSISNRLNQATSNLLAQVQIQKPAVSFYQGVDKYMVYSDGQGNAFKLPKKLYDAVACPELDASCHARLKNLQARISEASLSSDFTGVLEILESLDQ